MAKKPQAPAAPRAPRAPQERTAVQNAPLAADQQVLDRTDAEKARDEAAAADAEKARQLAEEQHEAHGQGLTGQEAADALKGEDGTTTVLHSITDPKAAPVDYDKATMRRAPHAVLPVNAEDPRAIAVSPYGREPRSIDTGTGLPVAPEPAAAGEVEDEKDADVDAGRSAADRAAGGNAS